MTAPPTLSNRGQVKTVDYDRDSAHYAAKSGKYRSSHIFDLFKMQKDQIDGNLTTSQYMNTLDSLLYGTIKILLDNTNYFEQVIGGLVAWSDKFFRRRIGADTRDIYIPLLVKFMVSPNPEAKLAVLRLIKVDRGILIAACSSFLEKTKRYREICNSDAAPDIHEVAYMRQIELSVHSTQQTLPRVIEDCAYMLERTMTYRGAILSKYYRLAILAAKRDYEQFFACRISLDDMCPDYVSITGRAIDRCDYERGPLTSHVQNWFMTARTVVQRKYDYGQQELNHDFDQDSSNSRGNNSTAASAATAAAIAAQSDQLTVDPFSTEADTTYTNTLVRFLARLADPKGALRKTLGIDEYLMPNEIDLLKRTALRYHRVPQEHLEADTVN